MCDQPQFGEATANHHLGKGKTVYDQYPGQTWLKNPLEVQPGRCSETGAPLTHEQMNPPNRMPRHMTDAAYQSIINRPNKHQCYRCNDHLSQDKVGQQQVQPRELRHYFCPECFEYECILAGIVHGNHTALEFVQFRPAIEYNPQPTVDEIINMIPNNQREYVPAQRMKPLPVANKKFYR